MYNVNKETYEQIIAEDIKWLLKQPQTLERNHIETIIKMSADYMYGAQYNLKEENKILKEELDIRNKITKHNKEEIEEMKKIIRVHNEGISRSLEILSMSDI